MASRAGQHDHGNGRQSGIGPNFRQHFSSAFLGQVQVEQNQVGLRRAAVFVAAMEKFHRLFAVAHQTDPTRHVAVAQGFDRQSGVLQIVLDQKDFHRPAYGLARHSFLRVGFPEPSLSLAYSGRPQKDEYAAAEAPTSRKQLHARLNPRPDH